MPHQLGVRVFRTSVAKQRLRGPERLRRIFRTDDARWPHRVGCDVASPRATRSPHGHDHTRIGSQLRPDLTPAALPRRGGAGRPRPSGAGHVLRSLASSSPSAKRSGAGKPARRFLAASSGSVIRVDPTPPPAHQCAWHVSPTRIPTRHGSERREGMSRDGFPDRGSRPRTASAAAARFRAANSTRMAAAFRLFTRKAQS